MPVPSGIVAAIEAGATLVTPSAQRAAALREAWARRQQAAGRRVWPTPDVLPFDAFAERCLREQEEHGVPRRRLLSTVEQQMLWRHVATSLLEGGPALLCGPNRLAEALRRADGLMRRHAIPVARLQEEPSPEAGWLREARARVDARLDREHARLDWSDEMVAGVPPSAPPAHLVGFSELAPAQRRFLERYGLAAASALESQEGGPPTAIPRLYAASHPAEELEQLARWCRARLEAEPRSRLLVVVPDLDARRALVERALLAELDPQAIATGRTRSAAFALEGGAALLEEPRVAADLARLERLVARLDRERWLAWLRSPESGIAGGAWRAALERALLEWQGEALDLASLLARAGLDRGALAEPLASMTRAAGLLAAGSASPAHWARAFERALSALQREADPLDSAGWQVRERWCRMLEEYAAASALIGAVSAREALAQLQAIARRTRFAPASPDVAVLVTAATADPIVEYDGIWIAGLHEGVFPRPARLEGLLPAALQHAAGVVEANPRALLGRAEHELAAWRRRTRELVISWAREDGGAEQAASPLLSPWLGDALHRVEPRTSRAAAVWLRQRFPEPPLEHWHDPFGLPVPDGAVLTGGAALLQSANQCAFRGYAERRLDARAAEEPVSGVDVRLRGRLLHDALERLWQLWRSHEGLRSADAAARREAVAGALAAAARRYGQRHDAPVARRAIERERGRAVGLLATVIDRELARPPFVVLELERELPLPLDGFTVQCRIDRVDRLPDGSVAIIDYKTGREVPSDWSSERSDTVQMIAYRAAVERRSSTTPSPPLALTVGALGYLQMTEGRVKYGGVARDPTVFGPALRSAKGGPDWSERTTLWDAHLQWLARRVRSGEATVEPHAKVCRHCELSLLCRRGELESDSAIDEDAPASSALDDDPVDGP